MQKDNPPLFFHGIGSTKLLYYNEYSKGDTELAVWQAILLGIVQGITEFLPISSSGHLLVAGTLLGIQAPPLAFEIVLHVGTLVSVLIMFRKDILAMLKHPLGKMVQYLVIATIPAVIIALLLNGFIDQISDGRFLGFEFLATAALLAISERKLVRNPRKFTEMNAVDAVAMGGMQALGAVFPGVSRSGSTIVGGLFRGLDRKLCARFTFLMSIPAILGSLVFKLKDLMDLGSGGDIPVFALVMGTLAAAVFGVLSIRFMLNLISRKRLYGFALYVGILGLVVLILQILGVLFIPLFS